jgi:hypothetical protein
MRKAFPITFVLLVAWAASAQTPAFHRTDIPIAGGSQAVLVADFTSDGTMDIATIGSETTGTVSILFGNGDGTFQLPRNILSQVAAFAAGDFNLDGKMDLAVEVAGPGGNYSVQIMLGKGDGTFQAPIPLSWNSNALAVGDVNGDGKPDLIVTGASQVISIALGNGDGTFKALSPARMGGIPLEVPMMVADMNRDGKLDVIIAQRSSQTFQVLLGNGDGTFLPGGSVSYAVVDDGSPTLDVADLNGDGKPDMVVLDGAGIGVFLGNGNGTFQNGISHGLGPWEYGVAIADLNSDGKPDVIALTDSGHSTGSAWFLPGLDDGTLGVRVGFPIPDGPYNSIGEAGHRVLALVDLNHDGMLDLVTATDSGISILVHTISTPVSFTVTSTPAGLSLGVAGSPCVTPCNLTVNSGANLIVATSSPQPGPAGTQFVFSSWSDSGSLLHQIFVPATTSTLTAVFKTQFQLTSAVLPPNPGTVKPSSGNYYDAGTAQTISGRPIRRLSTRKLVRPRD